MNKQVIKRSIILCWVFLLVCLSIKLLGGNWFEIIVEDERFIKIGNYVDSHDLVKAIIGSFTSYLIAILYFLAVSERKSFDRKTNLIIFALLAINSFTKQFISNDIGLVFDTLQMTIMPLLFTKKWKRIIVGIILYLSFMGISLITKNIGIKIIDESTITSLVFILDLYIMLTLYYLYSVYYSNKEEK